MRNLLERLEKNVLVADGAMGTALYSNGLESCHEYNNISNPDSVFIRLISKLEQI